MSTGPTGPTVAIGPYVQVALEEAPNYESGSNAVSSVVFYPPLEELTDDEKLTTLEEANVVRGFLAKMPHLGAAKYEPSFKMGKVHPRPSHLGFLLAWMLGSWSSTAGDGSTVIDPDGNAVPVGVYQHVLTYRFAVEPQTAQVLACTGNGEHRLVQGAGLSKLDFLFENGALVCDADGLALVTKPISIGTAPLTTEVTPVLDTHLPFRQGNMVLSWLGSSALTRSFTFAFNSPVELIWSPIHSSLFPSDLWYANKELPFVSGTIDKATVADADWAALSAGTTFAAKIEVFHGQTIGSSGYASKMWVEMPACELTKNTKKAIAAERRREVAYDWEARYDVTTDRLVTVVLTNDTPTLATYVS
jgi:hypothetical protein